MGYLGERGQSETLGVALLLGLTIISVGALAMFGGTAADAAERRMAIQSAEHAMSQFDSRVAMVGLGRSEVQELRLGQTRGGTYSVNPKTGWLRITHTNFSGNNKTEIIANISNLGEVVYRNEETVIAYQGGGVWRKDEGGGATMISPPEFHYRGSTLTLPILNITGGGSVSGSATALLRQVVSHRRIFPNSSAEYNGTSQKYLNPIGNGTVNITVKSDYYRAWETYFRTRTDGNVSVNPNNETVTIQLVALGTQGAFNMPLEGNAVKLRGLTTHQIDKFTITLFHDQSDNANFNNLDWSLWGSSGSKQFEMNVVPVSGTDDGDNAKVTLYYSPNGSKYQGFETKSAFKFEAENKNTTDDWNSDGDYKDKRLVINLTSEQMMNYTVVKTGGGGDEGHVLHYDPGTLIDTGRFDHHKGVDWEPENYTDGEKETVNNVTNHFLALMGPTIKLTVEDHSQNSVAERISTGFLEYDEQRDLYLTYLHVTENRVMVRLR